MTQSDAERLARAMRLDRLAAMSLLATVFPQPANQKLPEYQNFAKCLLNSDLSEIINIYAAVLRETIPAREIRAGLEFYTSQAGEKFDAHGWHEAFQGLGLPSGENINIVKEEEIVIEKFKKSQVGKTLWGDRIYETPVVFKKTNETLLRVVRPCMAPLVKTKSSNEVVDNAVE